MSRHKSGTGLIIILLVLVVLDNFGLIFNIPYNDYRRPAEFELHHLFPQQYFRGVQAEIDRTTLRVRNYEHTKWLHGASMFDSDWYGVSSANLFDGKPPSITLYAKRKAAFITGANVIDYQWFVYNYRTRKISQLFATKFDGVSNLMYNLSYIFSIPYKLVHFSLVCLRSIKTLGFKNVAKMFGWMLVHLSFGFTSAVLMSILGPLIGIFCHPLETLANLTVAFSHPLRNNLLVTVADLVKAVIIPLVRTISSL